MYIPFSEDGGGEIFVLLTYFRFVHGASKVNIEEDERSCCLVYSDVRGYPRRRVDDGRGCLRVYFRFGGEEAVLVGNKEVDAEDILSISVFDGSIVSAFRRCVYFRFCRIARGFWCCSGSRDGEGGFVFWSEVVVVAYRLVSFLFDREVGAFLGNSSN